jgi:hypothetical protein
MHSAHVAVTLAGTRAHTHARHADAAVTLGAVCQWPNARGRVSRRLPVSHVTPVHCRGAAALGRSVAVRSDAPARATSARYQPLPERCRTEQTEHHALREGRPAHSRRSCCRGVGMHAPHNKEIFARCRHAERHISLSPLGGAHTGQQSPSEQAVTLASHGCRPLPTVDEAGGRHPCRAKRRTMRAISLNAREGR